MVMTLTKESKNEIGRDMGTSRSVNSEHLSIAILLFTMSTVRALSCKIDDRILELVER